MEYEFEHLTHVDVTCVGRTVCGSAAGAGLDASYDGPVSCFLDGAALAESHLHGSVVIEESRVGLSVLDHLAALLDQVFRSSLPDSDSHYGLSRLKSVGNLKAHV